MRAARYLAAVDSHTEGMPTRVVTGGVGPIPGATMLERKLHFEAELDDLRLLLMREPRGHSAMSGAILQPPTRDDADWGVLFIEVSGCLPMCGHGTIGVATVLVETGMVEVTEPETEIALDTPAGLVRVRVAVEGGRATAVTLRNVPSFLLARDREIDGVPYDMAYGGNFYALVEASAAGMAVDPARSDELIARGLELMAAINRADAPVHPEDARISGCRHVVFYEDGPDGTRNATAIEPGWLDRSPCGTGTSARMAAAARPRGAGAGRGLRQRVGDRHALHRAGCRGDDGRRAAGGRARDHRPRVGDGMGQYLLDPSDPFPAGFAL